MCEVGEGEGEDGSGVDGWVDGRVGVYRTRERERETGYTRCYYVVVECELW